VASPQIDDLPAVLEDADRGADVALVAEVVREGVGDRGERGVGLAADQELMHGMPL
jgi:hypothetical protein